MSDEHFTVDWTLIQATFPANFVLGLEAWAPQKELLQEGRSNDGGTNFHGQQRMNQTHDLTADSDARLYKKSYGRESHMVYVGRALVENRKQLAPPTAKSRYGCLKRSKQAGHSGSPSVPTKHSIPRTSPLLSGRSR